MKVLKLHGINVEGEKEFFDGCALGKAHRQSFGTREGRKSVVGEKINPDVCGPLTETSVGGARYFVCFRDRDEHTTKYRRVFFITKKK
jgi:hypothetical protein